MLCFEILIAHLLRLRTEYETLFVAQEHVRQPGTLCQDEVKFLFFFLGFRVRRWELIPDIFGHRVNLLVDFLFGDGEHLLKIAMNGCLQYLVALEGPQLSEVEVYKRSGRQDYCETQR